MKTQRLKLFTVLLLSVGLMFSSCSSSKWAAQSNQTKGGILGGTGGAAIGAGLGAILAKKSGKGAVIGAAVGGAVGTGAGILIGKKIVITSYSIHYTKLYEYSVIASSKLPMAPVV